ncbi:MAG: hypothetical protein QM786_18710 [Breznakibacter sp.]
MKKYLVAATITVLISACCQKEKVTMTDQPNISGQTITRAVEAIRAKQPDAPVGRMEKGVAHIATLWRANDGDEQAFVAFCAESFIADDAKLAEAFGKISRNMEVLQGHFNKVSLELQRTLHEPAGQITPIDEAFGGYNAASHLINDLYDNKIAFSIALNFPFYTLGEKEALGHDWTRQQWAYARLGDLFTSRVPSGLIRKASEVESQSDIYISGYNIYAGNLRDANGKTFFPKDMVLLSHWNLRDELKANYGKGEEGLAKQQLIYTVMQHIIGQTIPQMVINNGSVQWDPVANVVYKDDRPVEASPENDERFQQILNNFHALKAEDDYSPINTFIRRSFEEGMEISQPDVEKLFVQFLSSPQLKEVGALISKRLGRDLKPWDIWYDGFKARSGIHEEDLDKMTQTRYPNARALKNDLPDLLIKLGFSPAKAAYLSSKIDVDAARGSGHAWGASMKGETAHLRTRIPETGMNYKGYNIAIHEFGHNVEQTISLYDVDYYMLQGVPNTGFTEALAFIFQKRDLDLLGIHDPNPNKQALAVLDNFWSTYEIMGVSLLDQRTWKWMYEHPGATAAELKHAVVRIAKEVWNEFYAPVYGVSDQPILAVYSHMVSNPLYLSNYAIGNLVEFQVEAHLKNHQFASEVERLYKLGRLTPNAWMQQAVGSDISIRPMLDAASEAVNVIAAN